MAEDREFQDKDQKHLSKAKKYLRKRVQKIDQAEHERASFEADMGFPLEEKESPHKWQPIKLPPKITVEQEDPWDVIAKTNTPKRKENQPQWSPIVKLAGTGNSGDVYCEFCGFKYSEKKGVCPKCGKFRCHVCGNIVDTQYFDYCPECWSGSYPKKERKTRWFPKKK